MENRTTNPAFEKARDFMIANLENGTWQPGDRIPSTPRLAKAAGIGLRVMVEVVKTLKDQ